jgi:hypothetical protein
MMAYSHPLWRVVQAVILLSAAVSVGIATLAAAQVVENSSGSSECSECVNLPIILGNEKTNIIIHTDDNIELAVESACSVHGKDGGDKGRCIESVRQSVTIGDWVQSYLDTLEAINRIPSIPPPVASRHSVFTVMHKLRKFAAPRSLLVIGAPIADALIWNAVNSKANGGFVCFAGYTVIDGHDLPDADVNCPYVYLSLQGSNIDASSSATDPPYFGIDEHMRYSHFPWDAVVVYPTFHPICSVQDSSQDILLSAGSNISLLLDRCMSHNVISSLHDTDGRRCTNKLLCMQTYLNYGIDLIAEDGYAFVFGSKPTGTDLDSPFNEIITRNDIFQLNFVGLEEKFLYRHSLSPHVDDNDMILTYYTSQV